MAGMTSCGDDNYYTENRYIVIDDGSSSNKTDSTSQKDNALEKEGSDTKPTDWVTINDVDPTVFMVVSMDSNGTPVAIGDDDMLAAFVGTECRGVATPYKSVDGTTHYSMVISQCANSDKDENDLTTNKVELRYYSASKHRIYTAATFEFAPGSLLGNINDSYKPTWK